MLWFRKPRAKKQVVALLEQMSSRLSESEFEEVHSLIHIHEEFGAALDLLSKSLYEHQVEISQDEYTSIQTICNKLEMPQSIWEPLEAITRD